VRATLEILAGRVPPRRVRIIDLADGQPTAGFDPLSGPGDDFSHVLRTAGVVMSEFDSRGPQWEEYCRNSLLLARLAGRPLTDLEEIFRDRDFRARCLAAAGSPRLDSFWRAYDAQPTRQDGIASSVLNKFSLVTGPRQLRRVLGSDRPLDVSGFLQTPGSVLLASLAVHQHHSAARAMERFLLASIAAAGFSRTHVAESRRNPIRIYADEFETLSMGDFEAILCEGRRFGLHLVISHQSLSQLTPKMRSLILANAGVKVAFRCGHEDQAALSRDMGADPEELGLRHLPVGHAVVWTSGGGLERVEVNSPIVRDVGALGRLARRFVGECVRLSEADTPTRPSLPPIGRAPQTAAEDLRGSGPGKGAPRGAGLPRTDLEDWLA
jgi:hypothetical protein